MPELIDNKQIFSLLEVTESIRKTLANRYRRSYWIKAEMNRLNYYSHSGHCYPDLVEKKDGKVIAQIRANLWSDDYQYINSNFIKVLKEPLKDGIKILISATIGFHPQYGLSLRILDIDPSFTLGDLEREKQETIERLRVKGIFDQNKSLRLPLLPQRVAIISVETSKGYADFLRVFQEANESWKYRFFHLLFPSLLQGEKAVPAIIRQLNRIRAVVDYFDVVAIVRGGGGDIGLSCYNNYDLAKTIALFPIPIITGIGHATNLTVVEMVSFKNAITPTKLAEYLIQQFHNFSVPVREIQQKIIDGVKRLILEEKHRLNSAAKLFRPIVSAILHTNKNNIVQIAGSLSLNLRFKIKNEIKTIDHFLTVLRRNLSAKFSFESQNLMLLSSAVKRNSKAELSKASVALNNMERNIEILNPKNILRRGFSITFANGKLVRNFRDVKIGDTIDTVLCEGEIKSNVLLRKKSKDEK